MAYAYYCVYSVETPDDGQRNCPKHVEFYSKNKFEKLVHLVGFIIRMLSFSIRHTFFPLTNGQRAVRTPELVWIQ